MVSGYELVYSARPLDVSHMERRPACNVQKVVFPVPIERREREIE